MADGNLLGSRRYYAYTSDTGAQYKFQTDLDLGEAVGATLNDTLPNLPRRFKPRGTFVQGVVDGRRVRKFLICPTADNEVYSADVSQVVPVAGVNFFSTGRKGEQISFGQNPPSAIVP